MKRECLIITPKSLITNGCCMSWRKGAKECCIGIRKADKVISFFGRDLIRIEGREIEYKYNEEEIRELIERLKSVLGED